MSTNEKIPISTTYALDDNYLKWKESIQPCEISENDLEKIKNYLCHNTKFEDFNPHNPIDVTNIVKENYCKCGCGEFFIEFKETEPEIETIKGYLAFNENKIISGLYSSITQLKEDYPISTYCKLIPIL